MGSSEIINIILQVLGIKREDISTYRDYTLPNGAILRLRISDHGVNLSTWFRKNIEQREKNPSLSKLYKSANIALTFAPNKEECIKKGIAFPQKAINKTRVKSETGKNVKPQFSVGHIQYASWRIDNSDVEKISKAVKDFTESGIYTEPLGLMSDKVLAWQDTSNLPPRRILQSTNTIKLAKSESPSDTNIEQDKIV